MPLRARLLDAPARLADSASCVSIPQGCRSSAARCCSRSYRGACGSGGCSRCRSSCSPASSSSSFAIPTASSPSTRRRRVVLSPADGRVLVAGPADRRMRRRPASGSRSASFCRRWTCTSTACRCPGRVTRVSYTPGRFLPAYRHDAASTQRAQRDLDRSRRPDGRRAADRRHPRAPRRLPRCRPGAEVRAGDRFGIMKFGSRMDVFLPLNADDSACKWARWCAAAKR